MRISIADSVKDPNGAIVVFVTKGKALSASAADLDKRTGKAVSRAIEASKFKGDQGQFLDIIGPAKIEAACILLVGLGDPEELDPLTVEKAGGAVVNRLKEAGPAAASIMVDAIDGWGVDGDEFAARLAYGALLNSYRFDKYFTSKGSDKKAPSLKRIAVVTEAAKEARKAYRPLEKIAQGAFFTRDLVSEPANVLYPESFAEECRSLESLGIEVEVLGEKEMTDLGMGSLLGVGQGSARESQIVVMQWKGAGEQDKPLAFVGKGVTFDTGGISIKPASGMEMMKWDMGGAGAVSGLMKALAGRKAKANVVGVIGLVENMPSSTAQRPGDVVTSMSGKTIEVINTDAEGRLVLADALHYTQDRFSPQFVINLATLTGAIITSLGNEYAGLFSNNDELSEQLRKAGEAEGEKVWRMPLGEAYDKMIKSGIADMKNVGSGGKAGSITAAQFLQRFIIKDTPWAHLDIAGMAWTDSEKPTVPKGGTGYGVRLLDRLVADHYEG
ncbi:MAG: leucyl aminopeptidase [Alphaproteobacteria bacterium]